jgi:DNA repair protein RadC
MASISIFVPEKPREKLIQYGVGSLSDTELLALVLKTGTKQIPVLNLAQTILDESKDLLGLTLLEYEQLIKLPGIKKAKACELCAIGELSRRMVKAQTVNVNIVDQPQRLIQWLRHEIGALDQENFLVVFLNTKNHVIGHRVLFQGGLDRSIVHPREIFKHALAYSAARIIVVHNHPSGDTNPSQNDLHVTEVLEEAGTTMGIPLLDHIIITKTGYTSLRSIISNSKE